MVQALILAFIGIDKCADDETNEIEDEVAGEIDLPEDAVNWADWRTIRWVETNKVRRRGGRAGNRRITDIPQPKIIVVKEGFDGLHSWKRQTMADRQWAKHHRRTWGRGERRRTA